MPPQPAKRKAPEISVPENGPERKRLLNVLAQRRYRQRKNERLRALETQAKDGIPQPSCDTPTGCENAIDIDSILNESSAVFPFALPDLPSPPSSTELGFYIPPLTPSTGPSSVPAAGVDISHLQTYQSSTFTFPDDHLLQVPPLTLLNAAVKVAQRLNVVDSIWDLSAMSPFYMAGNKYFRKLVSPSTLFDCFSNPNAKIS